MRQDAANGAEGMAGAKSGEQGFTLVELMVVVLIIGILISIATPLFLTNSQRAAAKSCQANQRTISGSLDMARSVVGASMSGTAGVFDNGGSTWVARLIPDYIRVVPYCPLDHAAYLIDAQGKVLGDNGGVSGFKLDHALALF